MFFNTKQWNGWLGQLVSYVSLRPGRLQGFAEALQRQAMPLPCDTCGSATVNAVVGQPMLQQVEQPLLCSLNHACCGTAARKVSTSVELPGSGSSLAVQGRCWMQGQARPLLLHSLLNGSISATMPYVGAELYRLFN